jgi:hypothetical protein
MIPKKDYGSKFGSVYNGIDYKDFMIKRMNVIVFSVRRIMF